MKPSTAPGVAAPVNLAHFQEWRRSWRSVEDLAVIGGLRMSLTGVGEPERLQTMRVSANLFSLIGVHSRLGRTFAPRKINSVATTSSS